MRTIVFALLAAAGTVLYAQSPAPPPSNPGPIFQLPPAFSGRSPQFTQQMPGINPSRSFTPQVFNVSPQRPEPDVNVDPDMVVLPPEGSFAVRPARPAMRQDLYPGLKIQPTELASVAPLPTVWPNAKTIPIPITWPHAKFELIPRTVGGIKAVPARSAGANAPTRK